MAMGQVIFAIGIAAPLFTVVARLIQGISIAGELSNATVD
jgi:hypothetical protein